MRIAIALFLLAHGLAHLVGVLTPWGLSPTAADGTRAAPNPPLLGGRVAQSVTTARRLGILWVAAAALFGIAAYGVWSRAPWDVSALAAAALISLMLTIIWWPLARVGTAINTLVVGGLLAAWFTHTLHG